MRLIVFLKQLFIVGSLLFSFAANAVDPYGYLDGANSNGAYGWAYDPDLGTSPIDVHFYLDGPAGAGGTYLGMISADQPRPDINGTIPGDHGFVFSFTNLSIAPGTHQLYAYAINSPAGNNPVLTGSPKSFTINYPAPNVPRLFGVHSGLEWKMLNNAQPAHISKLVELGVQISRNTAVWGFIESTKGVYNWSVLDQAIDELSAAGIQPLLSILGSPVWANGTTLSTQNYFAYVPTTEPAFSQWLNDYKVFVHDLVERYKDRVHLWELWNEPNWHDFWLPAADPVHYATWAKSMDSLIKSLQPTARIAYGALTILDGYQNTVAGDMKGTDYLTALYNAGISPEAISLHPYALTNLDPDTYSPNNDVSEFREVESIKAIMDQHGQGDKEIWLTEFGWDGNVVSEMTKANYLTRSFDIIKNNWPYVTIATWFIDSYTTPFDGYALISNGCGYTYAGKEFQKLFNPSNTQLGLTVDLTTKQDILCFGDSTGQATFTTSCGASPYTYSWIGQQTGATATTLKAGTHTVKVIDKNGMTGLGIVTIKQPAALQLNTSTQGTSASANVSGGTPPYSYSWSDANMQTTATATNLTNGSYTVLVTDNKGCSIADTISIISTGEHKLIQKQFLLYPNNGAGQFIVQSATASTLTIVNCNGAFVKKINISKGRNPLDLSYLSNGIYFVWGSGLNEAPIKFIINTPK